jgi:hypothetical protein
MLEREVGGGASHRVEYSDFATGHVYVMDGAETTGGLCSQGTHE